MNISFDIATQYCMLALPDRDRDAIIEPFAVTTFTQRSGCVLLGQRSRRHGAKGRLINLAESWSSFRAELASLARTHLESTRHHHACWQGPADLVVGNRSRRFCRHGYRCLTAAGSVKIWACKSAF
jgi:hypothetical protein